MTGKKTIPEKNLWQRLPMRWRVVFVFIALVGASYGMRQMFPMTPTPRDGQKIAEVKEFFVDTVFEAPEESPETNVAKLLRGNRENAKAARNARVAGVYVSKLAETGGNVRLAYKEFTRAETIPAETHVPENAENPATLPEKAGALWDASIAAAADAWKNFRTEKQSPVLLIHGVGSDGSELYKVARELVAQGAERVIVPDLPGAGASQRDVREYSIEASAGTLFSLLDTLEIANANVLGFGEGGGVAIYMAHQQPERVRSLALAASVGAQEFELLGNHIVNKIVYTFHLGFFKLVQDVLPHFGLMDRGNVNKAYARVLWDSDISELKKYVREWDGPLFLAHGKDDLISPFVSAQYNAALAPHAQTHFVAGGHYTLLREPKSFADDYAKFLAKLASASETKKLSRQLETSVSAETAGAAEYVYPPIEAAHGARVLVLMLVILVCTFVAEDPTCLASGLLVAQGLIDFVPALLACLIGIFIGDLALYLIGRFLGRTILKKPPFKWIVSEQQIDEMSERFSKNPKGLALIVSSRFIPGSRVPTFIAAGIMKLDWHKLIILFFIAAALWTPPLILLAEKVGASVIEQFKEWHHNAAWIVIGAIVALYLTTHYIIPAFTWRGRRRHVMTRHHITRHEYWPRLILSAPVFAQFLFLSLIYRSFSLWTLANRAFGETGGMPAGSKFDIYKKFLGENSAAVKTIRVPAEKDLDARLVATLSAMSEAGIAFPCVFKPEIGDGGIGVCIVRSNAHLKNWLEANIDDAIAQEFVGGNEYEVIWSRRPGRREGRIQSVVQKDFVCVKGDGERKLDELIWAHDKGVSNGLLFSKLNFRKADRVLKAGEIFPLAPLGTRIKGARFFSRPELRAGTLANVIDEIADACGDVHFVCLDIRAASDDALLAGNGIRITGVKGAGTFSSAIFDGYVRLGRAYARVYKQMNFCFSVGAELRDDQKLNPTISAFRLFEIWGTARGRSDNYVKEPEE